MKKTLRVTGYDVYGQPMLEDIEVIERPERGFLARFVFIGPFWNLGKRLGVHSFWRIKSIKVIFGQEEERV